MCFNCDSLKLATTQTSAGTMDMHLLAGLHIIARLDRLARHAPVARRENFRVGQIQLAPTARWFAPALNCAKRHVGFRACAAFNCAPASSTFDSSASAFCLRGIQIRLRLVAAALRGVKFLLRKSCFVSRKSWLRSKSASRVRGGGGGGVGVGL